ncbi:hypothetical protein ACIRL3_46135 [Streptomyces sp. NPDC102384]|uniref:hypothetical protein n=1 Tax=Streptomyces sp. NPDC102384 TaxID=3366166 RepID=UPI003827DFB7
MNLAYSGRGSGSLISALLPDWAEGPVLVLIFAVLIGLAVYGRYKQRRDGTHPPRVNAAVQRGGAWVTLCGAVLAEVLGLIGIFTFGATWWAGVAPLVLCVFGIVLVRWARADARGHR